MAEYQLKKDAFREKRGGYSRFLNLYCSKCHHHVLLYQKDGPGPLKRLYVDRIVAPIELVRDFEKKSIDEMAKLTCPNCKALLAIPYIYEKELRPALLVEGTSLLKKLGKGTYPPSRIVLI